MESVDFSSRTMESVAFPWMDLRNMFPTWNTNRLREVFLQCGGDMETAIELCLADNEQVGSDVYVYRVRVRMARGDIPDVNLLSHLRSVLPKCVVMKEKIVPTTHTAYEENYIEAEFNVRIAGSSIVDALSDFVPLFCQRTAYGLHEQPWIEFVDCFFDDIKAEHRDVDINWISLGNMPNQGLYFSRGSFTPRRALSNDRGKRSTGDHLLTSWAHLEHDRRIMTIYFTVPKTPDEDGINEIGYKLIVSYNSFHSIVVDFERNDKESTFVFIRLRHPPQLWEAIPARLQGRQGGGVLRFLNMIGCREWIRVLQWAGSDEERSPGCSKSTLANSPVLALAFPKETLEPGPGQQFNYCRSESPTSLLFEILSRWRRRSKARLWFGAVMKHNRGDPLIRPDLCHLTFRARYCIEAMLSRGTAVTDLFDVSFDGKKEAIFFRLVKWCIKESRQATEESLENLLAAVDERRQMDLLSAFLYMYQNRLTSLRRQWIPGRLIQARNIDVPDGCVLVRKLMVMPLRTLLLAPEVMMRNRVLFKFGEEKALRVVFRDDNGTKCMPMEFCQGPGQERIVRDMVISTLKMDGLPIAGRVYHFLAWSNSQMRDHGCYLYADDPTCRIEKIRNWMGDFSGCRSVPKLMSRMGQCLTQAQPTLEISDDQWRMEDDVMGGEQHPDTGELCCFSDGVGRLSGRLSKKIAKLLPRVDENFIPSCFQVRFKGFKGVLSHDPCLDEDQSRFLDEDKSRFKGFKGVLSHDPCLDEDKSRFKGFKGVLSDDPCLDEDKSRVEIVFRKSQKKFESKEDCRLEIVKYSMPSGAYCNRPLLMILDQVSKKQGQCHNERICNRVHSILEKELNSMAGMLCIELEAVEALSTRLNTVIDFKQLSKSGFFLTMEPFFRSLLLAVHRHNIRQQLSKAKICLPGNMARTMYGILDETGILQYGQVFLQYSRSHQNAGGTPIRFIGKVMVTKNPCHVAGDVRVFEAIFHECLSHLVDVIVFPRYGRRSHPDEMAGSDLDGDEYTVIFDRDLMIDHNEEAMIFPKPKVAEYDEPPTTRDMVDFFLNYVHQDTIGRVSNAHLMIADRRGLFDEVTNGIAIKCSVAVDFPKTGIAAEPLTRDEVSHVCPDFMQNHQKPAYRSKSLLGQLYRKTKKVEDILDIGQNLMLDTSYYDNTLINENILKSESKQIDQARRLRDLYNAKIQQLLDEYGISDEASIVSGHIVTLKRLAEMERDDYSFYHTDKLVELRYEAIAKSFRKDFFEEFGDEQDFIVADQFGHRQVRANEELMKKAQIWYMVTYGLNEQNEGQRFFSFPWIVWDVLILVKRQYLRQHRQSPVFDPLTIQLTDAVNRKCLEFHVEMEIYKEKMIIQLPAIGRFFLKYGFILEQLLFAVDHWLTQEKVYESSIVTSQHAAILVLQFGMGILHGWNSELEKDRAVPFLHFRADSDDDALNNPIVLLPNVGKYLLDFVRYIASRQFERAPYLRLDQGGIANCAMVLTCPRQWAMLHAVAFKAFHHVALTGSFVSLHLTERGSQMIRYSYDYGEMEQPIVVRLNPATASCSEDNPIAHSMQIPEMALRLKEWSGAEKVVIREATGRHRGQWFVSAAGNVESRHRLQRILLIEQDRLQKHFICNTKPPEAFDEAM